MHEHRRESYSYAQPGARRHLPDTAGSLGKAYCRGREAEPHAKAPRPPPVPCKSAAEGCCHAGGHTREETAVLCSTQGGAPCTVWHAPPINERHAPGLANTAHIAAGSPRLSAFKARQGGGWEGKPLGRLHRGPQPSTSTSKATLLHMLRRPMPLGAPRPQHSQVARQALLGARKRSGTLVALTHRHPHTQEVLRK